MGEHWPRIAAETLAEKVYAVLQDRILRGQLPAGEFIREQEVSDGLGVSRTPVREALGRLASEGFVERIPHRGFRIPQESVGDLLEVYPIVASLEVLATRLSFDQLGPDDYAELRRVNEQIRRSADAGDGRGEIDLNHRFHQVLTGRCGNRRLRELLEDLRMQVLRLEFWSVARPDQVEEAAEQHDAIVEALEAGELERGLTLLQQNRMQTYRAFLEERGEEMERPAPARRAAG